MASGQTASGRRAFLISAARAGQALGVRSILRSSAIVQGSGVALLLGHSAHAKSGDELIQPSEIRSKNGVLEATLTAAPANVQLGDYAFPGLLYNGSYLPPTLRVRVGEVMRIRFKNRLPEDPSNLHFHGMNVSPRGNSDNVFIHVHPRDDFDYVVRVPARDRQGPGLFWYHPHAHGVVAKQILGGMSGGLVVDGFDRLFPIVQGMPERYFFIKHAQQAKHDVVSINGQIDPVVPIRPGETQFWRIANIGATMFMKVRIDGMPLYVMATDGHALTRPRKITEFFVGPGQRIDAIAIGPPAGQYAMHTVVFQNEAWRPPDPAQRIATIVSAGTTADALGAETEILRQQVKSARWVDEVRAAPIAHRRTLKYSRTADRKVFMINDHTMDEHRIDQTVKLGDTEEWTITNTDQQFHSFHIHQTAFLLTEVNGIRRHEEGLRDTFSIPPATNIGPGTLKVVIPFTDPVIVGRFVFHCHAVDHEDKGMMGTVEVVA